MKTLLKKIQSGPSRSTSSAAYLNIRSNIPHTFTSKGGSPPKPIRTIRSKSQSCAYVDSPIRVTKEESQGDIHHNCDPNLTTKVTKNLDPKTTGTSSVIAHPTNRRKEDHSRDTQLILAPTSTKKFTQLSGRAELLKSDISHVSQHHIKRYEGAKMDCEVSTTEPIGEYQVSRNDQANCYNQKHQYCLPGSFPTDTSLMESINRKENVSLVSAISKNRIVNCQVTLYNNGKFECQLKRSSTVKHLFKLVTAYLKIWEVDYFALKLQTNELNIIHWLELDDSLSNYSHKAHNGSYTLKCCFSVKFYLTDPSIIEDDNTRYFYFSQVYADISKMRVTVPVSLQPELYGLVLQSQLGDYNPQSEEQSFPNKSSFVLNSTPAISEKACEYHKQLIGFHPPQAEAKFLDIITKCFGYSFVGFSVYNENQISVKFNLAAYGIVILSKGQILDIYEWHNIHKISVYKKSLKLNYFINSQFTTTTTFHLNQTKEAESIYKYAKSYLKFYCKRYLPQKKIYKPTKFTLSRSKSFVLSASSNKSHRVERSSHSILNSSMSFHDPISLMKVNPENSFINNFHTQHDKSESLENQSKVNDPMKQTTNFTVNIEALKKGLLKNKDDHISHAKMHQTMKSILKDNSLTEMLESTKSNAANPTCESKKKPEKRVTIVLEKKTSTVSLDSFSYKSES